MAIDTTTPRSRRALLTAAVGGAAAAVAATVAKVSPVEAADPNDVVKGVDNFASSTTKIHVGSGTAFHGSAGLDGVGIFGSSTQGSAVHGATGPGTSAAGLSGDSPSGYGLRITRGRIKVEEVSGVAVIKKGRKSVTVKPGVDINAKTFMLLTPMHNMGTRALWFTKNPASDKIVIRMSSTRGGPTKIAWLALERG